MPLIAPRRPPVEGTAPSWTSNVQGAHVWDAHGRRHLDMSCAHGAVLLGHADPRVEAAAAAPGPHAESRLGAALAARWGRSGDCSFTATAQAARDAAFRLAVRATGRLEVIPVAGPADLATGPARLTEAAALVVDAREAAPVLQQARALAAAAGALLILDETATALRRPCRTVAADVVIAGAGLSNGRALGMLAADPHLLSHLPQTPQPCAASLAAACAVLAITEQEGVPLLLVVRGAEIQAQLEVVFAEAGAAVGVGGDPTAIELTFAGPGSARRRFLAQVAARGVHAPGVLHVSARHGDAEIGELLDAFAAAAPLLAEPCAAAA